VFAHFRAISPIPLARGGNHEQVAVCWLCGRDCSSLGFGRQSIVPGRALQGLEQDATQGRRDILQQEEGQSLEGH